MFSKVFLSTYLQSRLIKLENYMITFKWTGSSGQTYLYEVYSYDTAFNPVAANYCVAKIVNQRYQAIYFGQTSNLKARFENHEKEDCFKRNGATQIHVHQNGLEFIRKSEETDLIANYGTICNG